MASAFNKEVFRSIKGSLARFVAIALIVALGAGFYAGLRMTSPDMKLAADIFYDATELYDIRILSTLGITDEDIEALDALDEVESVMPAYQTDVVTLINGEQYTVRIHSLDSEAAAASDTGDGVHALSDDDSYLNRPILVEGGWPTKPGECVLSAYRVMDTPVQVGDTVEIIEGLQEVDDVLKTETYTVSGLVNSAYYSSPANLGYTSLGSGYQQQYMYVPTDDFVEDLPYTEAFVTVKGAAEETAASDSYAQIVSSAQEAIETLSVSREEARYTQVKEEAQEEYDKASAELEAGKAEYEENLSAYGISNAEAEEEFAQAEAELADVREEIDSIAYPTWYVMDRTKNIGAESFQSDAGRINRISQVFPFLFFLVAALVALTTMTRMVDEERMLIGTYKALGYGKARIASKYLIYAVLASGLGSVVGIMALSQVLPTVIFRAYAIVYSIPEGPTPIDVPLAALSAAIGVGVTLIATAGAAAATLREKPASLMLPRAPKPGKRILLERITPLWKRVSFSWKVTLRNIFRYKRRFFMTVIGIAGCTALLLTGLGLSDAINDIISKQFYDIYGYNAVISVDDDISPENQDKVDDIIESGPVYGSTSVHESSLTTSDERGKEYSARFIVPRNIDDFSNFIDIRERKTQMPLPLSDDSLIICEKLANELNVAVGDTLSFSEIDEMGNAIGATYDFTVGGICENYVGIYVYASSAYYEKVTGEDILFATTLADVSTDSAERKELSNSLLAIDGVKTVGYNDEAIESYRSALKSVDSIVVVLVVAAAVLAFVVLYNLTNINITERQREIATLKVLGFVPREVDAYIFRETILLTVIGALVGLVLGIFMENYVVITTEVDEVMFGREIHALSFVIAFLVTLIFSLFIAFAMRRKLTAINMVESLKSVE